MDMGKYYIEQLSDINLKVQADKAFGLAMNYKKFDEILTCR